MIDLKLFVHFYKQDTQQALLSNFSHSINAPEVVLIILSKEMEFTPELHGLDKDFRLPNFSDRSRGLSVDLHKDSTDEGKTNSKEQFSDLLDIDNLDYRVVKVRDNAYHVQCTGFLHLFAEDPFAVGKIMFVEVFSRFNALGLINCDNVSLQIWESINMTLNEKQTIAKLLVQGFEEASLQKSIITNISANPNINFGVQATASAIIPEDTIVHPGGAEAGDVLVLTKPLGLGVAIWAHQFLETTESAAKIKSIISEENVQRAYKMAVDKMTTFNIKAAAMMQKYEPHGAVYIGKRGILGHAEDWAEHQTNQVFVFIHNLPIIHKMAALDKGLKKKCRLLDGYAPEIGGGLMICFKRSQAASFCKEFNTGNDHAWIIGTVHEGERMARLIPKVRVIEAE